jgi:hypothetical protein
MLLMLLKRSECTNTVQVCVLPIVGIDLVIMVSHIPLSFISLVFDRDENRRAHPSNPFVSPVSHHDSMGFDTTFRS